jgi:hypothetical protein
MPTTRIKAATFHFIISTALSALVICLLFFGWYPPPYFVPLGGLLLLVMIVGIDMILGPLMTLILYNPTKSRRALLLDLSLIAIMQISAMGYGLYSGYTSRIVFKVFDGKSFHLVQAADVLPNFLKRTKQPEYRSLPFLGSKYAMSKVPDSTEARNDLAFFRAFGLGAYAMPQYYVSLQQGQKELAAASIIRTELQTKHPALASEIESLLQARHTDWTDTVVIPFEVKTDTYAAVVRLNPIEVMTIIAEDPR